jgi:aminoglycoside/choline kinase family phosphotransferase
MTPPASSGLDPEALAFVREAAGADAFTEEIAGDASTRRFFRVRSKGGTSVLMVHGEALAPDAPLFTNQRILAEVGAPVPAILAREQRLGLVLVEDFGDLTLQRRLLDAGGGATLSAGANPGRWMAVAHPYYYQACDLIALMQAKAPEAIRPTDFAARNALDRERFLFELGHFDRHFLRGLRGTAASSGSAQTTGSAPTAGSTPTAVPAPTAGEERVLQAFYEELADACDQLPRVYCHRDYQSRNLMIRSGERLGLVDFQDARMGPYTYDPASLLRDSSLDLEPALVTEMLDRLARSVAHPIAAGPEEFRRDFDLMSLQRNIKDLGTFGYMATVRGRRDYLEFVPRTQESIRRTMTAYPRWHDAFEVVSRLALAPLTAS